MSRHTTQIHLMKKQFYYGFLYAHNKMLAYIVVAPVSVCRSVHNCFYWLHFLIDFFFHFWGIGQYHRYDCSYQIVWWSDHFPLIQSILRFFRFTSLIVQDAKSKSKLFWSSQKYIFSWIFFIFASLIVQDAKSKSKLSWSLQNSIGILFTIVMIYT